MAKYTKINNVYDDGFSDVCFCCNEHYPIYKVKLEGDNYNVHLNNKQFVRFFNDSQFKAIQFKTIKNVEFNKYTNTITLNRSAHRVNVTFKSKKAKAIYEKLYYHMNCISTSTYS